MLKIKKYHRVKRSLSNIGEYQGVPHSIFHFEYWIPKKVPIIFHNGSTYGYHFIIKELVEESEKQFKRTFPVTLNFLTFLKKI